MEHDDLEVVDPNAFIPDPSLDAFVASESAFNALRGLEQKRDPNFKAFLPPPAPIDWSQYQNPAPTLSQVRVTDLKTCTSFALAALLTDMWRRRKPGFNGIFSPTHLHQCIANLPFQEGISPDILLQLSVQKKLHLHAANDGYPSSAVTPCQHTATPLAFVGFQKHLTDQTFQGLSKGPTLTVLTVPMSFWKFEGSGIYTDKDDPTQKFNHSVELLGCNFSGDPSTHYWLIRNSQGPNWGAGGIGKIAVNACNLTPDGPNSSSFSIVL